MARSTPLAQLRLSLAAGAIQAAGLVSIVISARRGGLLVLGGALLLLGGAVRRRLVVAWVLTVGVMGVVVVVAASGARHWSVAALLCLAAVLPARLDMVVPASRQRLAAASRGAATGVLVLVGIGVATTMLITVGTSRPSLGSAVRDVLRQTLGGLGGWRTSSRVGTDLYAGLPAMTGLAALILLAVVLCPMPDAPEPDAEVRRRVALLCDSTDGDSLAPFTRRHDKSYVFSSDGRAVIGYRVIFGMCIAGPGPVGASDARSDALAKFVQRCAERGWRPAMIGASDDVRQLARGAGMRGIRIGDLAVLQVATFDMNRPALRNVRQAVQRTRNAGVVVTMHREGELVDGPRAELVDVVRQWRGGRSELGFAMTLDRLLENTYPDTVIAVAHHHGRAVGFQRYLLCRGGSSLSLDVMPRLPHAPNGVNERLIVEALAWAATRSIDDVSLNFAAFRTLFEAEPSTTRAVLRRGAHLLDSFINVESLYRFNAKFRPDWVPRHVLYRSYLDIPRLLCASLRLEFGHHRRSSEVTLDKAAKEYKSAPK
ncbi:MAG: bifunctional lysylphosphatidylglycerol flippase/synthetase MprF [Ilumatobacteraceae bacterium]